MSFETKYNYQVNKYYVRPSKIVYVGLEGSGKSLLMARDFRKNIYRNAYWYSVTGIPRPIWYNIAIGDELKELAAHYEVPLFKWHNLWDLITLTEADLYIDELATYFDSRAFMDLPLEIRLWLAQAEKLGVEIIGATQDYFMIDKSYRRLTKQIFEVRKWAGSPRPKRTAPPIGKPWAIFTKWELDPLTAATADSQVEIKTVNNLFFFTLPAVHRLKSSDLKNFLTNIRVELSEPPPLKKVTRVCPEDGFTRVRYL